ncbi:conserved hypothetical protein [Methylobacterium sp. 4-46]|uniref:hypothetical protein n=1 Tax=unclassified Methylobacterium TaxID=2615210 RepID=UPI000152D9E4|nr:MULTISPECIES: hypothetical protein [Methylobacterium]ACA15143.1 conserved hypothetical protein [Methylobacterium sp. 4-46]WFT80876.1 hypothetical protein QA634_02945 [Methylobacterium nodulans]
MPPSRSLPLRALIALADVAVAAFVIGIELLRPLYRPLYEALSRLALVRRLEAGVARLPRFAILALLAVPFLGVEPLKLVGVVWIAEGRPGRGLALLAGAYLVSFVLVERIYHAGRAKLLTIGWFAVAIGFAARVRGALLAYARATRAWGMAAATARRVRALLRRLIARAA